MPKVLSKYSNYFPKLPVFIDTSVEVRRYPSDFRDFTVVHVKAIIYCPGFGKGTIDKSIILPRIFRYRQNETLIPLISCFYNKSTFSRNSIDSIENNHSRSSDLSNSAKSCVFSCEETAQKQL